LASLSDAGYQPEDSPAHVPLWADGETLVIGTHFETPTAGRLSADGDSYRLDSDI
jgi:hypothetical protein